MTLQGQNEITNGEDVIDSRDVIARIEYLQDTEDEDEKFELAALEALQSEAEGYSEDWKYGSTLIRDTYFEDYAQELADDVGAIDRDAKWPCNHIDWSAAADELKVDYTEVDFGGGDVHKHIGFYIDTDAAIAIIRIQVNPLDITGLMEKKMINR